MENFEVQHLALEKNNEVSLVFSLPDVLDKQNGVGHKQDDEEYQRKVESVRTLPNILEPIESESIKVDNDGSFEPLGIIDLTTPKHKCRDLFQKNRDVELLMSLVDCVAPNQVEK